VARLRAPLQGLGLVAAFVAATMAVFAQQPSSSQTPAQSDQVFRGATDFVYVDVYPRRGDRLVEGLTAADFEVFEDGKPQQIQTFELIRTPTGGAAERRDPRNRDEAERWIADPNNRVFVVYLDLYHITRASAHALRGPMTAFLSRTIGPSDVIAVMTPETPVSEIAFARTLNTLSSEIEHYWAWGLAEPPIVLRTPGEEALAQCGDARSGYDALIRRHRDLVLFTSLESLITRIGSVRDERTSVIFLSEGWTNMPGGIGIVPPTRIGGGNGARRNVQFRGPVSDAGPAPLPNCGQMLLRLNAFDPQERFKQLLQRANAANVSFYPIDVGGLRTYQATASGDAPASPGWRNTLRELAENTDGFATADSNDLGGAFQRITDSLSGYYLLGYYTTNTKADGKYRTISVRVKTPGVSVTARRGYLAPMSEVRRPANGVVSSAPVPADVAEAIGRLSRMDADASVAASGVARERTIDIVIEIAGREWNQGRWHDGADVRIDVVSDDGRKQSASARIEAGRRSVDVNVPRDAADHGPWHAFVDVAGGARRMDERIEIDAPTEALLDAPRVSRALPRPRAPFEPVAALEFQRGDRVHVEWPLRAPVERRAVRVLDRRGQPLALGAAMTETSVGTDATIVVDVNLAAMAEGDYVFEVEIASGGKTARALVPFRVTR
jgi:VWFA-related protein